MIDVNCPFSKKRPPTDGLIDEVYDGNSFKITLKCDTVAKEAKAIHVASSHWLCK